MGGSDLQNSNIAAIYNAGSFTYTGTNTNSSTYFYSTGTVELTADNVDFKLKSDIHNTMKCKNVKIQNSTAKYICGIEATGKVENVDGPLVTSNVIADELSFDGNPVYLTQGGHIKVATTISLVNSNSHVYAVENSTALVETVNFKFGNKNDLTHTFSDNIYFKVSGKVDVDGCYAMGSSHNFATVDEYLAYEGHNSGQQDEYPLAKERVNAGNAAGSPACGNAWSIGTGGGTPEPGEDIEIPIEDPVGGETITKKYSKTTQLIEQGRVFCEDLGQISSNDLDFNDVVFDAYIYEVKYLTETTYANGTVTTDVTSTQYDYEITLWAAGGTLALQVAEKDVKNAFGGEAVSTIINTAGAGNEAYGNHWAECKPTTLTGTSYERIGIGDLPIVIQYSNHTVLKLDANLGQAPHKICVPIGTKWPKERQKIAEAYSDFNKYVTNGTEFWNGPKDESKLYVHPEDNATERSTEIMEEDLGTVTETESSAGGYNGTEVLSRPTK